MSIMAKQTNTKTASKSTPVKKEVAPKKVVAKKEVAPAQEAASVATAQVKPTEAAAPVTETVAPVVEDDLSADFSTIFLKLQQITAFANGLRADVKALEKKSNRIMKAAKKAAGKRSKRSSGNKEPKGFTMPCPITNELAKFLGVPAETEMARTQVTKELTKYIQGNKLQDPTNGQKISPDAKLTGLLKYKKNEDPPLTYFNLQRFMAPHFLKPSASVSV
jgi:chromatin remodeling complex protein RSC6